MASREARMCGTDSVTERCVDLQGLGLCSNYNLVHDNLSTNKMDSVAYVDLQATWRPGKVVIPEELCILK